MTVGAASGRMSCVGGNAAAGSPARRKNANGKSFGDYAADLRSGKTNAGSAQNACENSFAPQESASQAPENGDGVSSQNTDSNQNTDVAGWTPSDADILGLGYRSFGVRAFLGQFVVCAWPLANPPAQGRVKD